MNDIFWFWFEVLINILEASVYVYVLNGALGCKYSGKRKYIFSAALIIFIYVEITAVNLTHFIPWITSDIIQVGACFIYGILCLNGGMFKKLLVSLINVLLLQSAVSTVASFISFFSGHSLGEMIEKENAIRLLTIILIHIVQIYVSVILVKLFQRVRKIQIQEWILILSNFIMADISIAVAMNLLSAISFTDPQKLGLISILLIIIAMGFTTYFLFLYAGKRNEDDKAFSLSFQRESFDRQELENLKSNYLETQQIRHDMKNNILCISELIQEEQYDEAQRYCARIGTNIERAYSYVMCDNVAVGCLINTKITQAKKLGIVVKCMVTASLKDYQSVELCGILGNLLDNAIEANGSDAEDRLIDINIYDSQGITIIKISNTVAHPVLSVNKELKTTKSGKHRHGLGHVNVEAYTEKLAGKIIYSESENRFVSTLFIPQIS